jgi:hypothetical protein
MVDVIAPISQDHGGRIRWAQMLVGKDRAQSSEVGGQETEE